MTGWRSGGERRVALGRSLDAGRWTLGDAPVNCLGDPLLGSSREGVEDLAVPVVGEQRPRRRQAQPLDLVDLVARRELPADDGHDEVAHRLGAALAVDVARAGQLGAEEAGEARLLLDLAEGGLLVALALLPLALGEGPVLVLRPVDDEHLGHAPGTGAPHDPSGGPDGHDLIHVRIAGLRTPFHASRHDERARSASARSMATSWPATRTTGRRAPSTADRSHASVTTASWRPPSTSCRAAAALAKRAAGRPTESAATSAAYRARFARMRTSWRASSRGSDSTWSTASRSFCQGFRASAGRTSDAGSAASADSCGDRAPSTSRSRRAR